MKKIRMCFMGSMILVWMLLGGRIEAQAKAMVSAGNELTGIVKANGTLWMCGDNAYGQLGTGDTKNRYVPTKVMDNVESVSVGGPTAILKKDKSLWICGRISRQNYIKPQKIMDNVAYVDSDGGHVAIVKTDGSLWMYGSNYSGELGTGDTADRFAPVKIMTGVSKVDTGSDNTAIVKTDGSLWMCGDNDRGQLGTGDYYNRSVPVKIMDGVSSVSVGNFCTAIVKGDNSLWMCGTNYLGAFGNESYDESVIPVKIMSGVSAVSISSANTAIVKTDGSLWMCGDNDWGQIGNGTCSEEKDYYNPVKIMSNVIMASAGVNHTVALRSDGTYFSWGKNKYGQLGDGTDIDRLSPIIMKNLPLERQEIYANSVYTVTIKQKAFNLNVKTNGGGKLSFASSNKKVVDVNNNGDVHVKGYGTATIRIKATALTGYTEGTKSITVCVTPAKVKLKRVRSAGKGALTLKWKKDKSVTGYQAYMCKKKNFKKGTLQQKFKKSKNKVSFTGFKSKKKYYVKIRAYKKIGKQKIYGPWSNIKKVKIK
ncbi:hypothetical protein B5E53_16905 [Eubacterium sp. An11]|uniref:RCC1 domain-containing protein n=1 Tax=Eubacterium sp. An11 TaxID=1965542 RepID=UPI000B398634|nr:hypothetical protein [Eubacterium sp. An11]OUQ62902.1 hypothetical protein B5E53_16905 [Eubacterium sp. An11]